MLAEVHACHYDETYPSKYDLGWETVTAQAQEAQTARSTDQKMNGQDVQRALKSQWAISRYESFWVPALYCFIVGQAVAMALPKLPFKEPFWYFGLLGMLFGLTLWTQKRWLQRSTLLLSALVLGGAYYQLFLFQPQTDNLQRFASSHWIQPSHHLSGVFLNHTHQGEQAAFRVFSLDGQTASGTLLIKLRKANTPLPPTGSIASISGTLRAPHTANFQGDFDEASMLYHQKITAVMNHVSVITILRRSQWETAIPLPERLWLSIRRQTETFRDHIANQFTQLLGPTEGALLGSIILGEHAVPVDRLIKQAFIQTGLIHLLAASGLNLGIVTGASLLLGRWLKISRSLNLLLAMGVALFYACLTGLPPSILRAGTMAEVALLCKYWDRALSPTSLLALAVTLILLFNPNAVGMLGFQLSVLSTFGIITMVPPLQRWLGHYLTQWGAGILLVPTVAQLWVFPIQLYIFHTVPLHSLLMNILALILVSPLTLLGFIGGFLGLFHQLTFLKILGRLGDLCVYTTTPLLKGLLALVQTGNQWPETTQWAAPLLSPIQMISCFLSLLLGLLLITHWRQKPFCFKANLIAASLIVVLLPAVLQKRQHEETATADLLPLSAQTTLLALRPQSQHIPVILLSSPLSTAENKRFQSVLKARQWQQAVVYPSAQLPSLLDQQSFQIFRPLQQPLQQLFSKEPHLFDAQTLWLKSATGSWKALSINRERRFQINSNRQKAASREFTVY